MQAGGRGTRSTFAYTAGSSGACGTCTRTVCAGSGVPGVCPRRSGDSCCCSRPWFLPSICGFDSRLGPLVLHGQLGIGRVGFVGVGERLRSGCRAEASSGRLATAAGWHPASGPGPLWHSARCFWRGGLRLDGEGQGCVSDVAGRPYLAHGCRQSWSRPHGCILCHSLRATV